MNSAAHVKALEPSASSPVAAAASCAARQASRRASVVASRRARLQRCARPSPTPTPTLLHPSLPRSHGARACTRKNTCQVAATMSPGCRPAAPAAAMSPGCRPAAP